MYNEEEEIKKAKKRGKIIDIVSYILVILFACYYILAYFVGHASILELIAIAFIGFIGIGSFNAWAYPKARKIKR